MLDFSTGLALWQIAVLALVSFLVGLLGGFVGLALGTMRLPAILLTGLDPRIAAGTNIAVSALASLAGGYRHLTQRRVNLTAVLWIGLPSVAGGFLGGLFSGVAPSGALIAAVGLLVTWQAVEFYKMWTRLKAASSAGEGLAPPAPGPPPTTRGFTGGIVGLTIGLIGGAVGLILGSLRLPVMIRMLRMDPRVAAGSNLIIGAALGLFGAAGHGIQGEIDLPLLVTMGLSGMVGSNIGARFTGRISVGSLVLTLSGILLAVGAILIVQGVLESLD